MPKVSICSAITKTGIQEIWELIESYIALTKSNAYFDTKRREQNQYWMMETLNENILMHFYNSTSIKEQILINKKAVQNNELSPFAAA